MKKTASALKIAIWISAALIIGGFVISCSDDVSGPEFDDPDTAGISFTVSGGMDADFERSGSLLGYTFDGEFFYQLLIDRPANVDWDLVISGPAGEGISDVIAGEFDITDDFTQISATFVDRSVSPQRTWTSLFEGMGGTFEIASVSSNVATGSFSFSAGRIGESIPEDERFVDIEGTFQVPVNPND
ncbi:MAG: hypothetical protein LAT84_10290 [Balneolia bacterium]|nr:hypothetical protein [Balneolia bacterium]